MLSSGEYTALKRGCEDCYQEDYAPGDEKGFRKYDSLTKARNTERRSILVDFFNLAEIHSTTGLSSSDYFVGEFGSGGRNECGRDSAMDLVVVGESAEIFGVAMYIRNVFSKAIREVDVRNLNTDDLLRAGGGLRPSRSFDIRPFINAENGLKDTYNKAVVEQLIQANGKKLFDQLAGWQKNFRRICTRDGFQDYKSRKLRHFNLDSGEFFYDPEEGIGSTKFGPLRAVQMRIAADVSKLIRKYENPIKLVNGLPNNTEGKLNYLNSEGVLKLSSKEVEELTNYYLYFLWIYHKSQFNYKERGEKIIRTNTSPAELKEALANLMKMLNGGLLNKKHK